MTIYKSDAVLVYSLGQQKKMSCVPELNNANNYLKASIETLFYLKDQGETGSARPVADNQE